VNGRRLRSIFAKEFIQMRRDRGTLVLVLAVPVMQLMMFGYAIRLDVRDLPTVVYDASRTQQSRALVQRFAATGNFVIVGEAPSYAEAARRLDQGRAHAAIVIPADYARRLKRGRTAAVQVLVDATSPTASQNAIGAAQLVGQAGSLEILTRRAGVTPAGSAPPIDVRVRPLYNPALSSPLFIVPGIIGMILSNILIVVTALAVVREREHGTLEQLIVTPLTRSEIMLGKIGPYVAVGFAQITAVLMVGFFLFHVPIRGNLGTLYALTSLFIVANLGMGLFVSTLAKTQAQSMQISFMILLPNVLLSGFMFPREGMPPFAREVGLVLPLTYYLEIVRAIVLKGTGVDGLWRQTLALAGFAVLFFSFATLRFRKQLE
jgi:ABC-2 type transport system permease protein